MAVTLGSTAVEQYPTICDNRDNPYEDDREDNYDENE